MDDDCLYVSVCVKPMCRGKYMALLCLGNAVCGLGSVGERERNQRVFSNRGAQRAIEVG